MAKSEKKELGQKHGQKHGKKHYDWDGAKVLQKGFSTNVYLITWRLGGLVGGCQGSAQGLWLPRPCKRALAARLPQI